MAESDFSGKFVFGQKWPKWPTTDPMCHLRNFRKYFFSVFFSNRVILSNKSNKIFRIFFLTALIPSADTCKNPILIQFVFFDFGWKWSKTLPIIVGSIHTWGKFLNLGQRVPERCPRWLKIAKIMFLDYLSNLNHLIWLELEMV